MYNKIVWGKIGGPSIDELQLILESSFDGILVTDGNGAVLTINKAYERLTGIYAEEMIGKNMRDLLNPFYMKNSAALMVIEERKPVTIPHQTRNGRNITVTSVPIYDKDEQIILTVTNVRDITEIYNLRKELEKAQEMEKVYYQHLEKNLSDGAVDDVIALSPAMKNVLTIAKKVSAVDVTVLLLGDSGVGKEVVAKYIHEHSPRSNGPCVTINCGAIPEQLLESELFGYVGGAFTGALKNGKEGLIETAQNGTLFLDEIGDLPLNLQVKVLRVLETRYITRVGSSQPAPVDVRFIAATNRNLSEMVQNGEFREDLFYRLNVVQIKIPPLCQRVEDIPPLSLFYLNFFNNRYQQKKKMTYDVMKELEKYPWSGNVRELKNIMESMVVMSSGEYLQVNDLPWFNSEYTQEKASAVHVAGVIPFSEAIENIEKQILAHAIQQFDTTRQIAEAVGVDQSTVVRKIQKYGLKRK